MSIKVAVVDDQALLRGGFAVMLGLQEDIEELRLAAHRQGMGTVNHRFALGPCIRPSAPSKKSFSIVS